MKLVVAVLQGRDRLRIHIDLVLTALRRLQRLCRIKVLVAPLLLRDDLARLG